jgi:hypothetical protein
MAGGAAGLPDDEPSVSKTTVKLLRAASEIVGGEDALAERLGVGKTLFSKFARGAVELPDVLLLRAVDIILADRLANAPPVKGNGASHEGPT